MAAGGHDEYTNVAITFYRPDNAINSMGFTETADLMVKRFVTFHLVLHTMQRHNISSSIA